MMRFSIREILLLTVIVAMVIGWSLQWKCQSEEIAELRQQLEFQKALKEIVEAIATIKPDSSGPWDSDSNKLETIEPSIDEGAPHDEVQHP